MSRLQPRSARSAIAATVALLATLALAAPAARAVAVPSVVDTTTTVRSSKPVAAYGNHGTITATVKSAVRGAATPSDSVDFLIDGQWFWTSDLNATGKAVLPLADVYPSYGPGTYSVTATYAGDAGHNGSSTATPASQTLVGISQEPVSTLSAGAGGKPVFAPSSFRMSSANPVGCNVTIANNTSSQAVLLYGTPGSWKRLPGSGGVIPAGESRGVGVGLSDFTGYFTVLGAKNHVTIHCV